MRKFKHSIFDERNLFKNLLLSDTCKKKNGALNLSEISRQTGRYINTIKREINRFKNIEDYDARKAHNDYLKKREKSIKKPPEFIKEQKEWLNVEFNKYHDTLSQIIRKFKKSLVLNFQHVKIYIDELS